MITEQGALAPPASAIAATVFDDVYGHTKHEVKWSPDLIEEGIVYHKKSDCPLIKLAVFGGNATKSGNFRHDENVLAITGAEADYDGGLHDMGAAAATLEETGISGVFYTSASHTPEKPRWRLLLPFSRQYTGTQAELRSWRIAALRKAEAIIGITFGRESEALSQAYFVGVIRHRDDDFQKIVVDGLPIDTGIDFAQVEVAESIATVRPPSKSTTELADSKRLLGHVDPDIDYPRWIALAMALKSKHGDAGFSVWDEWSAQGQKYPGTNELLHRWESFQKGGIGSGTLAHIAKENGAELAGTQATQLVISNDAPDVAFPDMRKDSKGGLKPLGTKENLRALMRAYNIHVGYDVIGKHITVTGLPAMDGEEQNALASELISLANRHELPDKVVANHLRHICWEERFNPVLEWLETLPKEAIECPVPDYVSRCSFSKPKWSIVAMSRWLIQACAAADYARRTTNKEARPEFGYALVLIGAQGTGKTSGLRKLLPPAMQGFFSSGKTLDIKSKDSHAQVVSSWITELGEIDATFRKSDISALKSFLTDQWDDIRAPYAKATTRYPRQTVFCATVNETQFLQDMTGNRRYWPLELLRDIPDMPDELILRLWQWAYQRYLAGEQWWPTPEQAALHQGLVQEHEDSAIVEAIRDTFDFDLPSRPLYMTPTDVLAEIGWQRNRANQTAVGIALQRTLKVVRKTATSRDYAMPPRRS